MRKSLYAFVFILLLVWPAFSSALAGERGADNPFGVIFPFADLDASVRFGDDHSSLYEFPDAGDSDFFQPKDRQLTIQLGYTFDHGEAFSSGIGVSASRRGFGDAERTDGANDWTGRVHFSSSYGPLRFRLVASTAAERTPSGMTLSGDPIYREEDVQLDFSSYSAGLSYEVPLRWGPVSKLTFYHDYTLSVEKEAKAADFQSENIGCIISAGSVFSYIDFSWTNDEGFMKDTTALDDVDTDAASEWRGRFIFKIGYFF